MNQMGNLEKLGILVIVILVVVVGVVAITPKEQVDSALFTPEDTTAVPQPLGQPGDAVQPIDGAVPGTAGDPKDWPLPSRGVLQADLPVDTSTSPANANSARTPISGADVVVPTLVPVDAQPTVYVVVKNDTGASIARKLLGKATAWDEIAALNPGIDARRLRIGQKIQIPAAKAAPTAAYRVPPMTGPGMTPLTPLSPNAPGTGPTAAVPTTTSEKLYVVQSGDTLSDIARREMGSASKWKQILDFNSATLHGSEVVRVGQKLRIPSFATTSSNRAASVPGPGAVPAPSATGAKSYKVQSGDTLTSIASRMLGSGARWREIQRANESVLHGSDRLTVGMELEIPETVSAR